MRKLVQNTVQSLFWRLYFVRRINIISRKQLGLLCLVHSLKRKLMKKSTALRLIHFALTLINFKPAFFSLVILLESYLVCFTVIEFIHQIRWFFDFFIVHWLADLVKGCRTFHLFILHWTLIIIGLSRFLMLLMSVLLKKRIFLNNFDGVVLMIIVSLWMNFALTDHNLF